MINQIEVGGFDRNFSYLIGDEETKEIAVVDPDDCDLLFDEIEDGFFNVKMVLLTHSHFDHVSGVPKMIKKYGIPVYMHEYGRGKLPIPDDMFVWMKDGDKLTIGGMKIEVWHTPGHSDDAVCYFAKDANEIGLITGDTLFVEGCGRADLEKSDVEELWKSLQKIKKLPDDVKIYPGHDYGSRQISDVGFEKANNKYLLCKDFEEFRKLRMKK